jgi:hypothetical protein
MLRARARRLLPALVVGALVGALGVPASGAPKGPASGVKSYAASSPQAVVPLPAPDSTGRVHLDLTNCGCEGVRTSSTTFGSLELRWNRTTSGLTAEGAVVSDGWTVQPQPDEGDDAVLRVVAGSGSPVAAGDSVRVSVLVTSAAQPGPVTFGTTVKQSNDFSGTGNDFSRVGDDPTVVLGSGPPVALEFVAGASSVQSTTSPDAPGVTAVRTMCAPPSVRLVDAAGSTVTWWPATAVSLSADLGDLTVQGGAVSTVSGVAAFGPAPGTDGACAASAGSVSAGTARLDDVLTAEATVGGAVLTARDTVVVGGQRVDRTFDVLAVYGRCAAECAPSSQRDEVRASAAISTSEPDAPSELLTFDVEGSGSWRSPRSVCDPDPGATAVNSQRRAVKVDVDNRSKDVTLLWSKKAVQESTNNGASLWGVCLEAEYDVIGLDGSGAVTTGRVVRLLPCGDAALADEPLNPCLSALTKTAKGQQRAVVHMPDREGDPRVY